MATIITIKPSLEATRSHRHLSTNNSTINEHARNRFITALFSGTTRVSRCQKKSSSGLCGARGDIRGRHTDNPAGRHSIRTNQRPTSIIPHFCAGCPSCRNAPNLSWLRAGTKYAGLHTQWRGSTNNENNQKYVTS